MHSMLQRFLALICLVAYTVGASPLLGALVAAAGATEADHQLVVASTAEGEKVVFHHVDAAHKSLTRHGNWYCKELMLACDLNGEGDHVFQEHRSDCQTARGQQLRVTLPAQDWPTAISFEFQHMVTLPVPRLVMRGAGLDSRPAAPPRTAHLATVRMLL